VVAESVLIEDRSWVLLQSTIADFSSIPSHKITCLPFSANRN
jgi:hypothetical protein